MKLCATTVLVLGAAGTAAAQPAMYALSGNVSPVLNRLDPATGAVLESWPVTGHEALFGGLACDAAGDLYSIDGYNDPLPDRLFRIDRATGAGTVVGPTGFNWNFRMLHVHPGTDVLYGARDNQLFTIDRGTGAATLVTGMTGPSLGQITALAINSGGQAFITNISGVNLYALDLVTGQATLAGTLGGPNNWYSDLAFDSAGALHGVRRDGGVYRIDTVAATETFLFGGVYTGLTFFGGGPSCYANCDGSTQQPVLNVADFSCFLQRFAKGSSLPPSQQITHYANCDNSTGNPPVLNVADFSCFLQAFGAGCP